MANKQSNNKPNQTKPQNDYMYEKAINPSQTPANELIAKAIAS